MISAKLRWTKENVRKFMLRFTFTRTPLQVGLCLFYCIVFVGLVGTSAVLMLTSNEPLYYTASILAAGVLLVYAIAFFFILVHAADKVYAANEKNGDMEIYLSDEDVKLVQQRGGMDFGGTIEWKKFGEIIISPDTAYLMVDEGDLLILEFATIFGGKLSDLINLLERKQEYIKEYRKLHKNDPPEAEKPNLNDKPEQTNDLGNILDKDV